MYLKHKSPYSINQNKPKEQVISFLQWFSSMYFFSVYFEEKVITNRNAFVEEFCNIQNKSFFYHIAVRQTCNNLLCYDNQFLVLPSKNKANLDAEIHSPLQGKLAAAETDGTSEHFNMVPFCSNSAAV